MEGNRGKPSTKLINEAHMRPVIVGSNNSYPKQCPVQLLSKASRCFLSSSGESLMDFKHLSQTSLP